MTTSISRIRRAQSHEWNMCAVTGSGLGASFAWATPPRRVCVVGATGTRGTVAQVAIARLQQRGWRRADEIWRKSDPQPAVAISDVNDVAIGRPAYPLRGMTVTFMEEFPNADRKTDVQIDEHLVPGSGVAVGRMGWLQKDSVPLDSTDCQSRCSGGRNCRLAVRRLPILRGGQCQVTGPVVGSPSLCGGRRRRSRRYSASSALSARANADASAARRMRR